MDRKSMVEDSVFHTATPKFFYDLADVELRPAAKQKEQS